ncbi:MAG: protein-tyrosine phosphatase family protein [Parachlamydiaceae bacterium]|nr:protein-tyrosine phosphatase family protein [Parachlamydiaceae bacterium]
MLRHFRLYLFYFILLFHAQIIAKEELNTLLILNMKNIPEFPKEFRTTKDVFFETSKTVPTREGFDQLNLSGSGQFSDKSFKILFEKLNHPQNFYLLDLRQESHGFINGDAVSWYGIKDWGNVGKTLSQICKKEQKLLTSILKQKKVQIALKFSKDFKGKSLPKADMSSFDVSTVSTEKQLAKTSKVKYIRIPVTDHVQPSDDNVDRFIDFFKTLPSNYWIHMHCSAGVGRTSTFMVMFDIMKNAKKISLNDILCRQFLIGGRDLRKPSYCNWKTNYNKERVKFIEDFYEYCRSNQDRFNSSWSLYKLLKIENEIEGSCECESVMDI